MSNSENSSRIKFGLRDFFERKQNSLLNSLKIQSRSKEEKQKGFLESKVKENQKDQVKRKEPQGNGLQSSCFVELQRNTAETGESSETSANSEPPKVSISKSSLENSFKSNLNKLKTRGNFQKRLECGKFSKTFVNPQILFDDLKGKQRLFRAKHIWDEKDYFIKEMRVDLKQKSLCQIEKWTQIENEFLPHYVTCWLEKSEELEGKRKARSEEKEESDGDSLTEAVDQNQVKVFVQMSSCEGTSLREFLSKSKEFGLEEAFVIFSHILAALESIHSSSVQHGNIK